MLKNSHDSFPVTIIGAGITGLSTAYHLNKSGLDKIKIFSTRQSNGFYHIDHAYAAGGFWSNFTRLSHARGVETAKEIWDFGDRSFDFLEDFCKIFQIPWNAGLRARAICSEHELVESEIAVAQLNAMSIKSKFVEFLGGGDRCIAVQVDGHRGASFQLQKLLSVLRNQLVQSSIDLRKIIRVEDRSDHIALLLEDGETIQTELLIVAAHADTGRLLPELRKAIIPVADQCVQVEWRSCGGKKNQLLRPGRVITANHCYEWAVVLEQSKLIVGGCRFLRKLAGIGDFNPSYSNEIEKKIVGQFEKTFRAEISNISATKVVSTDIYPCDELPLIGPMFGSSRILLSTGYMNLGLSNGFYAGQCLTELVSHGVCDNLPRIFWPERLRSL